MESIPLALPGMNAFQNIMDTATVHELCEHLAALYECMENNAATEIVSSDDYLQRSLDLETNASDEKTDTWAFEQIHHVDAMEGKLDVDPHEDEKRETRSTVCSMLVSAIWQYPEPDMVSVEQKVAALRLRVICYLYNDIYATREREGGMLRRLARESTAWWEKEGLFAVYRLPEELRPDKEWWPYRMIFPLD